MAPPAPAASTVTPRASKNRTGVEVARRIALDLRLTTRTMTAGSNIYGSQPGPLVHQPRASDFARPLAFRIPASASCVPSASVSPSPGFDLRSLGVIFPSGREDEGPNRASCVSNSVSESPSTLSLGGTQ